MSDTTSEPRSCTATNRDGQPCRRAPIMGASVCWTHGGATAQVREKARVRLLEAKVAGELVKRGWEPINDPLPAYADLAGEVWAWKELCREQAATLAQWDYRDAKLAEDVKPLVVVYERALDRARGTLVDMMRLGLDAQALRQAKERPSREVAEQFVAVLQALDLTEEQQQRLPGLLTGLIGGEQ